MITSKVLTHSSNKVINSFYLLYNHLIFGRKNVKYCPICNNYFNSFQLNGTRADCWEQHDTFGGVERLTQCPFCGSIDRDRLVYLYLKQQYTIQQLKKKNILHIAPERALSKWLSSITPNYIAADKFTDYWRNNYSSNTIYADITDLKYADNTFDIIICNHVLEHIENDFKAMSELFRVLKVGGIAILQVPIALDLERTYEDPSITTPAERNNAFGHEDHLRLYGQDYIQKLAREGFNVEKKYLKVNHSGLGIDEREYLHICHK